MGILETSGPPSNIKNIKQLYIVVDGSARLNLILSAQIRPYSYSIKGDRCQVGSRLHLHLAHVAVNHKVRGSSFLFSAKNIKQLYAIADGSGQLGLISSV